MACPLGHCARLVLALLRDRPDPLLYWPSGSEDCALFPCEPAMLIPWHILRGMLRIRVVAIEPHEGSAGRLAYVAHPSILALGYSAAELERHRGTLLRWKRSYAVMVARENQSLKQAEAA